jgi:cytochrome c-type biogenesis protein CcmF
MSVYDSNDPDNNLLTKLYPSKAIYEKSDKPTTEVDIKRSLALDLYTALEVVDPDSQRIKLRVLINPLINWIWIGSTISMIGTIIVLIPFYRKKPVEVQD